MDRLLQILLIIATILFTIFIIIKTSKKKLNYKLTLLWLCFGFSIIILAIFPQIIIEISKILHIETPVNALFLIFLFLLIVVVFYLSAEVSKIQDKITILVQENSLLKKKLEEETEKIEKKGM